MHFQALPVGPWEHFYGIGGAPNGDRNCPSTSDESVVYNQVRGTLTKQSDNLMNKNRHIL